MVVIGGYNSSNTQALARMCAPRVRTFYIDNPMCIEETAIRHRQVGAAEDSRTPGWLLAGAQTIGITAGASTPDSVVGEVLERILALRGCTAADLVAPAGAVAGTQVS
jgi:4-hydroxy-3-methylbut-2-enyl diphosphate reductase